MQPLHATRRGPACATLAALALAPTLALAQPARRGERATATVVRIDGPDLVIDTGGATGVDAGAEFTLYRPIEVRHPVTRRVIRDRFPIGVVRVTSASRVLSLARPSTETEREPAVGDELVLVRESTPATATEPATEPARPATAPPAAQPPQPGAPWTAPGVGADERDLVAAWLQTLGRPLAARVVILERYLAAHPEGSHRDAVQREVHALRLMGAARAAPAAAAPTYEDPAARLPPAWGDRAATLTEGEPAVVAVQIGGARGVRAAVLHVRARGAEGYTSTRIEPQGDGFLRARIAPAVARVPGFDYWLELVDERGDAIPAFGDASSPVRVDVVPPPEAPADARGRTRIELRADYVDRNRFRGNDYYTSVEGDFFQRIDAGVLYGYRVGFGVHRAFGGSLEALDARGEAPQHLQAHYGYNELDFTVTESFSLIGRLTLGVNAQSVVAGFQGRARFGRERGTNLVVGAEALSTIGQRGFFQVTFRPWESIPMGGLAEVTNFSYDGGDPSFRVAYQVGWQARPWVSLSTRVSYVARTINHAGLGLGLSATFDW